MKEAIRILKDQLHVSTGPGTDGLRRPDQQERILELRRAIDVLELVSSKEWEVRSWAAVEAIEEGVASKNAVWSIEAVGRAAGI